ncbi:flavin reductase family protein [bacterium]|nr:flavin reductase family protein [bacterium]
MKSFDLKDLSVPHVHHHLLSAVGPRPICFASTIDKEGNKNLAPFSFFNVFSANPPILVFSPARSGRTGETKHTHDNVKEVAEVVVNVVTYDMLHQMNLSSSPFPKGVDEFVKSGFTAIASDLVKPYRVKESPVQMECKVLEVKELGNEGAAGNLVICEVLRMHLNEDVLDENGYIDQTKADLVARMGGNWYCRAHGDSIFEVEKMLARVGVGVDALPENIRLSHVLNGNELGLLGSLSEIPSPVDIDRELEGVSDQEITLGKAKELLAAGESLKAYAVLSRIL